MQRSSEQPLVGEERYVTTLITAAKETTDCRAFSNLKTVTSYRSYSHSVQFFRPVKAIVRTDEANSMAFLQREFLPSNDTYKTKTSAGNTSHFIRGNENVTHSAQGETVFFGGEFSVSNIREDAAGKVMFISQTTDFHFANYRFPFRFVPFRFANYSKPLLAQSVLSITRIVIANLGLNKILG